MTLRSSSHPPFRGHTGGESTLGTRLFSRRNRNTEVSLNFRRTSGLQAFPDLGKITRGATPAWLLSGLEARTPGRRMLAAAVAGQHGVCWRGGGARGDSSRRAPGGLACGPGLAATRGLRRGRSRAGLGFGLLPQFTFDMREVEASFLGVTCFGASTDHFLPAQSSAASVSPLIKGDRKKLPPDRLVPCIESSQRLASTPQEPSPLPQGRAGCRCRLWLYPQLTAVRARWALPEVSVGHWEEKVPRR